MINFLQATVSPCINTVTPSMTLRVVAFPQPYPLAHQTKWQGQVVEITHCAFMLILKQMHG